MAKDAGTGEGTPARAESARSLTRAIDILEAVADGPLMLPELSRRVGLSTATCYRLAKVLSDRGLLSTAGRSGFRLGPVVRGLSEAYERQQAATQAD